MKKSIVFGLTAIFLMSASLSLAEEYTVKRGDCLSKIGQRSGVPWQEIAKANKVRPPKYIIRKGQRLVIPRLSAIAKSTEVKAAPDSSYLAEIKSLQAQIAELERKLNEAAVNAAKQKEAASAAVAAEKKEVEQVGGDTRKVVVEVREETIVVPAIVTAESKIKVEPPVVVVADNTKPSQMSVADNDQFGMYMSVGGWKSSGNKAESTGWYGQAKMRYRPFNFNLFGHDVGLGGFLSGETGSGSTGKWDYRWGKVTAGPNFKVYGDRWDATTDLGYARQWNFGVNDKQVTDSGYIMQYVNVEQRRGIGLKWLPQTELMFAATMPFSASKESTKNGKTFGQSLPSDDKSVYSFDIRQSIYDFNFDNHMRLTPGVLLGGGFEASNSYGKIGPFVKLAAYGQDILTADISVKEKSSVDGFRWYGALMLHAYGVTKAIKASRITQPTAEDLRAK